MRNFLLMNFYSCYTKHLLLYMSLFYCSIIILSVFPSLPSHDTILRILYVLHNIIKNFHLHYLISLYKFCTLQNLLKILNLFSNWDHQSSMVLTKIWTNQLVVQWSRSRGVTASVSQILLEMSTIQQQTYLQSLV